MKYVHKTPLGYETKFAQFIKGCAAAKDSGTQQMIIAQPWVIGDTYEEVMESLSRLSQAGLALHVVEPLPKSERN
jgi:hypothetical protein